MFWRVTFMFDCFRNTIKKQHRFRNIVFYFFSSSVSVPAFSFLSQKHTIGPVCYLCFLFSLWNLPLALSPPPSTPPGQAVLNSLSEPLKLNLRKKHTMHCPTIPRNSFGLVKVCSDSWTVKTEDAWIRASTSMTIPICCHNQFVCRKRG